MKTKAKILTILLTTFGSIATSNVLVMNTNTWSLNNNDCQIDNTNKNSNLTLIKKEFDGKLLGAKDGKFTIQYIDVDHCTLIGADKKFYINNCDYNFNGGRFTCDGITYTIVEIGDGAFKKGNNFNYCNLTIPSTIKKIGNEAFGGIECSTWNGNKSLAEIHFEEGIEYIGKYAFVQCRLLSNCQNVIVFPKSIKFIDADAFWCTGIGKWDLTNLNRKIETNGNISNSFQKYDDTIGWHLDYGAEIIVKNEDLKNQYLADPYYYELAYDQRYYNGINVFGSKKISFDLPYYYLNNQKPDYSKLGENNYFSIEFKNDIKNCKLIKVGNNPIYKGDFNFNGGHFTFEGKEYTITEIGKDVFAHGRHLRNCYLTIPSTIKKIDDGAFYNCSRSCWPFDKEILGIKFDEGIEEIGEEAFYYCCDIKEKIISLPNSVKHISNKAFKNTKVEIVDLSALDHVIKVDAYVQTPNPSHVPSVNYIGCLDNCDLKKIYVKDQEMKDKYCASEYWNCVSKYFEVK